jgi:deoxyhypusine synthase
MSHEANTILEEQIFEWMQEMGFDEELNLEELTIEQMQDIQNIYCYSDDPDYIDSKVMDYLEEIAKKNPKIWKQL